MTYAEKLKDPRWQRRRLEILSRDNWRCIDCNNGEKTLHVHHRWYERGREPWEYPDEALSTLCEDCHDKEKNRSVSERRLLDALRQWGSKELGSFAVLFTWLNSTYSRTDIYVALWSLGTPGTVEELVERNNQFGLDVERRCDLEERLLGIPLRGVDWSQAS